MVYHTIVIGGGAAGLMAAITAARKKQSVLVIEKNKILGRKILVTGNGRCNLTNINLTPDKYYGENTKCLHNIFSRFSSRDTITFFEELGVHLKTEEGGRVFPVTNQASTVVDFLVQEIAHLSVQQKLNERVNEMKPLKEGWEVITDKSEYQSKRVILTTGGKSYPQSGSTGDGFEISRGLGHRIIPLRPALVPLELSGNPPDGEAGWFHKLQGVKSDIEITLSHGGKTIACQAGELLFTHYGISGPVVLDLSRLIMDYLARPGTILNLNFFPGHNAEGLNRILSERVQAHPHKTMVNSLQGFLPKKLCYVLLKELKLSEETQLHGLSGKELHQIAERLTHWPIVVEKTRPFTESMVTAGGVALDEVNPRTMESLKAKGLYLAGEVLDIDGISGGYNLQFAWSSGHLAGLGE